MFAKKLFIAPTSEFTLKKELDYLYMRRSTVDALIRSIEEYSRCCPARPKNSGKEKAS